ncbi:glycosyltransferase family 4 protein [Bacillus sp. SD088]|uniref:glycosyltransferase family 4 protein n=1 Tax=Bacillus sp. SD088 TaxID=2782012 RepID=UPI001A978BA1|nr:glycosyltransferase family 4 protein [Bacillus sp. SD088]MBO0991441.1 glycosyltransferase family 4 protein [Bacillus sp. SD088]
MKILLITTLYPGYEGQSRKEKSYALHYFVKDWVSLGHEVKVVKVWPKYPSLFNFFEKGKKATSHKHDQKFFLEGVEVNRVSITKFPKLEYSNTDIQKARNKILKIISDGFHPNIVVCHMFNPSLFIANEIKKDINTPLVLTMHQSDVNHLRNYKKRFNRFTSIMNNIDSIGFRSSALKLKFEELKLDHERTFVIPSGIEEKLIINETLLREKGNSPIKTIFVAASLIKLKNIDVLIRAFDRISSEKNIVLKIAGDGPEREKLVKLMNSVDSKDKIEFLGFLNREQVLDEMQKSDIFAMVSSPETFGLVYLEAMAKGCITIGSKGEGIDGVIQDGINGFLCEPRNVNELTSVLNKSLMLEENQKKIIVKNALSTARNMTQKQLSSHYLEVVEQTIIKFQNT